MDLFGRVDVLRRAGRVEMTVSSAINLSVNKLPDCNLEVSSAIILSCENKLPDCNLEGTPAWCAVDDKRWRLFGAFVVLYEVWVRLFEDECHTSTVPQKGMISARGQ